MENSFLMLHYFYLIIFQAKCAVGTKVCGVDAFSFFLKHDVYHYIKKKKGVRTLTNEHLTASLMSYKHTRLTRNQHGHDRNLEWNHLLLLGP